MPDVWLLDFCLWRSAPQGQVKPAALAVVSPPVGAAASPRGSVSLHWLSYRVGDHPLGVIILDASDLLHARFRANLEGLDHDAEFAEGHELDDEYAAVVPKNMIGRMLSPDEARKLIDWIEGGLM